MPSSPPAASVIANDVELATVSWDLRKVENLPAIYKLTGAGLPAGPTASSKGDGLADG